MNNDTLITRVWGLLQRCEGWEGTEIAKDREAAWDYYFSRPRGDEVDKRSPVVSGDVSSMVEAVLASMTDAFETDQLAEFNARNAEDMEQAQLESSAVSALVMQNHGWYQLTAAVKNALLLRNAIVKVRVHHTTEPEGFLAEDVDPFAAQLFADMTGTDPAYDADARTLALEFSHTVQRLSLECVHPENFLYVEWPLERFATIPMCAERHIDTRQTLIDEYGFPADAVNSLIAKNHAYKSDAAAHAVRQHMASLAPIDKEQDLIEWFETYPLIDGKRRRVCISGNTVLEDTAAPVMRPPYAVGVVLINPGKLTGISLYDKLRTTQDTSTGLQRALHDNVNAVTMNRLAVLEGSVNGDQLTDEDPSGVLLVKKSVGDVRSAVAALSVPDASQGILANLAYQRQVRAELGGAALDVATAQVQLPDRAGSMGIDRAYSATEQLAALMLKTICRTLIHDLWLLAHATIRREWAGAIDVHIEGRWQSVDPDQWPRRESVAVKPGMSPGERRRRSEALQAIIAQQERLAALGMEDVLVDAERYYRAVCDWARLNDLKMPERYFIDPQTENAQRALEAKAAAQQAQSEAAQQLQTQGLMLEQLRIFMDKYSTDVRAAVDYFKTIKAEEQEEARLVNDLVKARESSAQRVEQSVATPSDTSAEGSESGDST